MAAPNPIVGRTVRVRHTNGTSVIGRVAVTDARFAWLRLDRVTGYWAFGTLPDPDALYPVGLASVQEAA